MILQYPYKHVGRVKFPVKPLLDNDFPFPTPDNRLKLYGNLPDDVALTALIQPPIQMSSQISRSLTLGKRVAIVAGVPLLFLVAIAFFSTWQMSRIDDAYSRLIDDEMEKANALEGLNVRSVLAQVRAAEMVIETDETAMSGILEQITDLRAKNDEDLELVKRLVKDATEATLAAEVGERIRDYRVKSAPMIELALQNKNAEAFALFRKDVKPSAQLLRDAVGALNEHVEKSASKRSRELTESTNNTLAVTLGAGLAAFIAAAGISFWQIRSLVGQVGSLAQSVTQSAEQTAAAAGQVSSASQHLAEGASEQASSLEETSSSLEEMASMTHQNSKSASEANTLMQETSHVVDEATAAMRTLTEQMTQIADSSAQTQKIIKTIDEIAFQTNILALNAAVEAARAGEVGAGFAVVADEVRNLAQRAAEAARNTASLIEGSVAQIHNGNELVARASEAFARVEASAKRASGLVHEIASASNEQSKGIDQINRAVAEMDKVTQQTASNAEESASAAEEMNAQAEQMQEHAANLMALIKAGARLAAAAEDFSELRREHRPSPTGRLRVGPTAQNGNGKNQLRVAANGKPRKVLTTEDWTAEEEPQPSGKKDA